MRTFSLTHVLLALSLLWGGAALAKRDVKEFQAPRQLSDEELEAAKEKARNGNMNKYGNDIQIKAEPVPWLAIGLAGIVFALAVPFAVAVYRNTSKEIATANTFGVSRGKQQEDEE